MSGIYGVGNSYYNPYSAATFTSRQEYRGPEDFRPGLYDPEQREKAAKRKRNAILVAATAVGIAAVWFFTKGKGKGLINKLKGLVKEYNLEVNQLESAYEFTVPKKWIKVKPPRKVSAENREKMSQRAKKMWENREKNYE